jgi:hypothetical protein
LKWILLVADRGQYKNVFNMIYNLWISWKLGITLLALKLLASPKGLCYPRQINLSVLSTPICIFTTASENSRVSRGQFI